MTERPTSRRLRILAFDPSLMTRLETAAINEITVGVPWEDLEPGPIGDTQVADRGPDGRHGRRVSPAGPAQGPDSR